MKFWQWTGAAVLALGTSLAVAQDAPESLLPPGFDDPAPAPTPAPRPSAAPVQPAPSGPNTGSTASPVIQPVPGSAAPLPSMEGVDLSRLPSLEQLEAMTPDELDELLGLKPKFDIPPAARRSLERVGVLAPSEGGLPTGSLANQPASLVRAALAGTKSPMVSRWGHILLRRSLASRLEAPAGMNPVEFAALRAKVLNAMGEHAVARAIVQDVDTSNWDESLTDAALNAYIGTADVTGACPIVRLGGSDRDDQQWTMLQAICGAYAGEGTQAGRQLDRILGAGKSPRIDVLLAQRFAGAAGRGRRAVQIEWEGVDELNPWRFALANAVGEEIPESLRNDVTPYYQRIWAVSPMLPLPVRAQGADRAAREGILSSAAIVSLYSQIYADDSITGDVAFTASRLREAYVAPDPADRLAAMRDVWGGSEADYGRYVLTAYAAARLTPSESFADDAGVLIASMLAAGLDRDAAAWGNTVEAGSLGWAQLTLARPGRGQIARGAIDSFIDDDNSTDQRKSRFLVAALAGLGRADSGDISDFAGRLEMSLSRQNRWSRTISQAAEVENQALVAMLAGLGMQGDSWERMTPLHLYHIVSALNRVGLEAEARMIAAEAVARG
ncbi:hypothetical protein P7228_14935 [Altererythrobacter arenosus]|uniref:Uncharacterized protein n=1 Tax=Altererythrobacter arenosus TaxID=3032592 RepID=A0ABY8FQG9_9SPHN|nr:hypothetical protein [Altererythrobacter sp. CAU 1644]WFL77264.1 hypothetical protein P7228_14935 [Altererythrobacter sp. CAU 1644]